MEDLLGDRSCAGLEDIPNEDEGVEIQVQVLREGVEPVTFHLKNAVISQRRPVELDSQGNLVSKGDHTLSIFGLVEKVDSEP